MVIYRSIHDVEIPAGGSCAALGLFDGLHPGHQAVISAAVEKAGWEGLTPCVFTFTMERDHPAAKPTAGRLLSPASRDRLLEGLGVTHVLCPPFEEFKGMTPEEYVRVLLHDHLRARFVFTGENYHFGKAAAGDVDALHRLGGELGIETATLPMVVVDGEPVSSSRVRRCIAEGDMPTAERLLGRAFALDVEGTVEQYGPGSRLLQTLPSSYAKPLLGRYRSAVCVRGERVPALTGVGMPTPQGEVPCYTELPGSPEGWRDDSLTVELLEYMG